MGTLTTNMRSALKDYNADFGAAWTYGSNFSAVSSDFETFVNKYLFPKLSETALIQIALGNRFDWLAKEVDFVGQYSEEYVIMDSVPVNMNLSKSEEMMLKRNYPKIATKLYGSGIVKKQKFTLNNNDTRFNFATLQDASLYAIGVYKKKISDINVSEELEIKAMIVDYALNVAKNKRTAANATDLFDGVFEAILNIQNNSDKYNEANTASGGSLGRYTTVSRLEDVAILTTDKMKKFLLDSKLANTFQVAGLDLAKRIISFDDLGGVYKLTADVTLANAATITYFKTFGEYQIAIGDVIPSGAVLTIDPTGFAEFTGKFSQVKPTTDFFAYVFDVNKVRYRRNTKGMLKKPFFNGEYDEVTHWIHYYSFKALSPFYNSVVIGV